MNNKTTKKEFKQPNPKDLNQLLPHQVSNSNLQIDYQEKANKPHNKNQNNNTDYPDKAPQQVTTTQKPTE